MIPIRERIFRDTLLYATANYAAMALGIVISLITKAILGPMGAGYWALMKVFQSYGEYADLGTRDALSREIPQAIGAGDNEKVGFLQQIGFAFTLAAAFFAAAVVAVIAGFISDPILRNGLWCVSALLIATHVYNYLLNLFRTLKKIKQLSAIIILNIVMVGSFSILGARIAGVSGLAIGLLASTAVSAFVAFSMIKADLLPRWDGLEIMRLIKIGLPMVALSYTLVTFLSIDTIMIGKMIGVGALGSYTIALMSVQQVNTLGRFTQIIIFPHIQERYGRSNSIHGSASYFTRTTDALSYVLPSVIGSVIFLVPIVVHYFLPKFTAGIPAMKILTAGYFFIAVNEMSSSILYTIDKQRQLIPIYGAMVILAACLNYFFINMGWGIEGVAFATSATYFIFFLCVFSLSFCRIMSKQETLTKIMRISAIFVYFICSAYLVDGYRIPAPFWLEALAKYFIFLLTQIPILMYFEKKEKIFSLVMGLFRSRYQRKHGQSPS